MHMKARLDSIEELDRSETLRLTLSMPARFTFACGQYLCVYVPDTNRSDNQIEIPLSIASAPGALPRLELLYRSTQGDPMAAAMDAYLTSASREWSISEPRGRVRCPPPSTSLLVVAAGSGISLGFSSAQHRAQVGGTSDTRIIWCIGNAREDFGSNTLKAMGAQVDVFTDPTMDVNNAGLRWLAEFNDIARYQNVILSGSPGFVWNATDVLLTRGLQLDQLQADVYEYAPR